MKRILITITVLTIGIVAGSMIYFASSTRHLGTVNGPRILAAAKKYTASLKEGLPIPASVSLQELISRRLLTEADVSGFAGMVVTINLSTDETWSPQDVLIRARLADGYEIVALGDGSVQQMRK